MTTEAPTTSERVAPPINEINALWNLIRFWASETDANAHRPPTNVQLTLQLNHDQEQVSQRSIPLTKWTKPYYETKAEARSKYSSKTKSDAETLADLNYFASHAVGTLEPLRRYPEFAKTLPDLNERYAEITTLIDDELEYVSCELEKLVIKPKTHPNFIRHLGYTLVEHARSLAKKSWVNTNHEHSIQAIIRLFKEGQRYVRAAEKVDPRHTEVIFSPGDEFIL